MMYKTKTITSYTTDGLDIAVNEFLKEEVAILHNIQHQIVPAQYASHGMILDSERYCAYITYKVYE